MVARVMATAMRLGGDKEGNGDGGKSNGDKGGGRPTSKASLIDRLEKNHK
jgi:hypothetical protein